MRSVTLWVSDGRTWQVRCSTKSNKFRLIGGWKDFVLDNFLKKDDICVFEVVDGKQGELRVVIFRVQDRKHRKRVSAQSEKPSCLLKVKGMQDEDSGNTLDLSDSKKHIENEVPFRIDNNDKVDLSDAVEPITSTDPTHSSNRNEEENFNLRKVSAYKRLVREKEKEMVETTSSILDKPFSINFPTAFATKYLQDAFQGVTLSIPNGATWYADFISGNYCKLDMGWKGFVLDNNGEEGNVCLFELVNRNHMELKASIKHLLQHSPQERPEVSVYDFQGVSEGDILNSSSP